MMKNLKLLLLAGIVGLFVACGDNGLVELKNNGYNSELYDYGVKQVQEKYPDYKLYSYESLKSVPFLKLGEKAFVSSRDFVAKRTEDKTKQYVDMIFAYKNDSDYKLIYVECLNAGNDNFCPHIVDRTKGLH
ncbi:hypothetical protein LS72_005065 [Helicobacter apodemus]|uniref:Uncharacterized protein n=1 Tax=Helicobacter apodemus TaxID=135569 RepID=A0A4U8UDK4_9HELI|nr:hypothetical protein [Helicobacter apodemus]TLE15931.1 hypothetical protein LS72_005065 [Helicobacter apodemus]